MHPIAAVLFASGGCDPVLPVDRCSFAAPLRPLFVVHFLVVFFCVCSKYLRVHRDLDIESIVTGLFMELRRFGGDFFGRSGRPGLPGRCNVTGNNCAFRVFSVDLLCWVR